MYNHSVPVFVKSIQPLKKIIIDWGNVGDLTTVEWTFKNINDNETFLSIVNSGFKGVQDKIISQVRDSTEGFTIVLAGLKARLEFGIRLNLVADRFPRSPNEICHDNFCRNKPNHTKGDHNGRYRPIF
jgi:hypothetical protein